MSARDYSREELLDLTPAKYLAGGFVNPDGKPRPELKTTFATAASQQFLAAHLSPQELAFTYEAVKIGLGHYQGTPPARIRAAVVEAVETVHGMIEQPNNQGLLKWIQQCAAAVRTQADLDAFLVHTLAILRLYSLIAAAQPQQP
jgi:hypothetical protein